MARVSDPDKFPAPVYKDEVLAPLFEGVKQHHWRQQMRINRASAIMLAHVGVLSRDEAGAILSALDAIMREVDISTLTYTGEFEDFFFLVESELKKRLGPDLAGKLHTGRSRNDIDHTVFKMALKERLVALTADLLDAIEALLDVAEKNKSTLIVAYTHGQPAQPSTYGHYLGAMIELMLRDVERVKLAAATTDLCSMGAAAITTSGFPLDRGLMAKLLGFSGAQENSYGCIAACDYISSVYSAIRLIFIHLGRFAQDLNSWTGFEIGHLHAPDAYVQISSIMPQKRNPVVVEHLRLMSSIAAGRADTMIQTLHNTPFTDMNDSEGEAQVAGYGAFDVGGRALRLVADFIRIATINEKRVRQHIEESCVTMTELADSLVRVEGLSFRQAHEVASHLSRRMITAGAAPSTVGFDLFKTVFAEIVGRGPSISEADFRRFLTPEHFVAVRDRFGGPAEGSLSASLQRYRDGLSEARQWRNEFAARVASIDENLVAAGRALAAADIRT